MNGALESIGELRAGNGCGTRDTIVAEAATLLSELELHRLARVYADEVVAALRRGDLFRASFAADALEQVDRSIDDVIARDTAQAAADELA